MPRKKAQRPKLYDDPPGTRVGPAPADGWEVVQRPNRTFLRRRLSEAGERKHRRLEALGKRGYEVISTRGAGMLRHSSAPDTMMSIAAAALREGIA